MTKVTRTHEELIQDIVEMLERCNGSYLSTIANRILDANVTYIGDSIFEVEREQTVPIAQLAEQFSLKEKVMGSIPIRNANKSS